MHTCPPCREFTPIFGELYKEMNEDEKKFEVIFFSGDSKKN
jgi:thiol-disulfide isomerase/thioredoxin